MFEKEWQNDVFVDLAFGGAVHDGKLDSSVPNRNQMGTRFLFRSALEVGYSLNLHHRLSIMVDHSSNADLADPSEGLDSIGLRYSYRF